MSKRPDVPPHAAQELICPVLGALVGEGKLTLDANGAVGLRQLDAAWRGLGVSAPLRAALQGLGYLANSPLDVFHNARHGAFNALDLRAGMLEHPADTGVLARGQFDEARFEALTSHAEDGVMTVDAFARAIAQNVRRDLQPGQLTDTVTRGMSAAVVEFAGLVGLFGRREPKTRKLGMRVPTLLALYRDKRLPASNGTSLRDTLALQAALTLKVDASLAASVRKSLAAHRPTRRR